MVEEETIQQEKAIRLNMKVNFKGERAGEITVRADAKIELGRLKDDALELLNKYIKDGE